MTNEMEICLIIISLVILFIFIGIRILAGSAYADSDQPIKNTGYKVIIQLSLFILIGPIGIMLVDKVKLFYPICHTKISPELIVEILNKRGFTNPRLLNDKNFERKETDYIDTLFSEGKGTAKQFRAVDYNFYVTDHKKSIAEYVEATNQYPDRLDYFISDERKYKNFLAFLSSLNTDSIDNDMRAYSRTIYDSVECVYHRCLFLKRGFNTSRQMYNIRVLDEYIVKTRILKKFPDAGL